MTSPVNERATPTEAGDDAPALRGDISEERGTLEEPPTITLPAIGAGSVTPLARFVTVSLASKALVYTERAINKKMDDGVWRRGREWRKVPDGRRLVDMLTIEKWVVGSAR